MVCARATASVRGSRSTMTEGARETIERPRIPDSLGSLQRHRVTESAELLVLGDAHLLATREARADLEVAAESFDVGVEARQQCVLAALELRDVRLRDLE